MDIDEIVLQSWMSSSTCLLLMVETVMPEPMFSVVPMVPMFFVVSIVRVVFAFSCTI